MKKTLSTPNLSCPSFTCTVNTIKTTTFRKSVSTTALASMDISSSMEFMDAIVVSNTSITQAARCIYPDALLNRLNVDKDFMTCLVTPCEAPNLKDDIEMNRTRNFLQLAIEKEEIMDKYRKWLARVRKMKK